MKFGYDEGYSAGYQKRKTWHKWFAWYPVSVNIRPST